MSEQLECEIGGASGGEPLVVTVRAKLISQRLPSSSRRSSARSNKRRMLLSSTSTG